MADKDRIITLGDKVKLMATGHLREVTVTKVTPTFIWVEYVSPSTGMHHNTKFNRHFALLGTRYF